MKKRLLKVFASILALTTITSCTINKPGDSSINWDVDLNKKIELKAIFPNSGLSNDNFKNSYSTQLFEERTGYKVDYNQIIDQDNGKVITNILATKDPYHVLKLDPGTYGTLQEQDSFLRLNELLEKYGQNILDIIPQEAWASATDEEGNIFAIPEIGFSGMLSYALVWNKEQLATVGINEIPETITEVDTALHKLQEQYGSDSSYHALAMQGSQADIECLSAAWDLPDDYYVDEKDGIMSYIYHDKYDDYLKYMNGLQRSGIITKEWQGYTQSHIVNNFVNEKIGCGYIPYWNVETLYESMAATDGITVEESKEKIGFQLYCRGDGAFGTEVQTKAKFKSGIQVAYFITIPNYMSMDAVYIMDWLNKKIENSTYDLYSAGKKGVHYEELTAKEVGNNIPEGYVKIDLPNGTVYRKPNEKYQTEVLNNSMYATGVNTPLARINWPMREIAYDAWEILVDTTLDTCIENPFNLAPIIKDWSNVELSARSYILTLEQGIINAKSDDKVDAGFVTQKTNYEKKFWNKAKPNIDAWFNSK